MDEIMIEWYALKEEGVMDIANEYDQRPKDWART